jgi:ketosteroid isomerase-like protein
MSNADVARSFYEGIEGGDLPAALDLLAPDVAWDTLKVAEALER